jgi:hypothetical protein
MSGRKSANDLVSARRLLAGLVIFVATTFALQAGAHHANSAYDRERTITVSGTVTRWQFINPHAGIWIDVTNEDGTVQEWAGEFQSIQDLYRFFSWNKDTFKPGDQVTLIGNPDRRPGQYSMWTSIVIFSDGTEVDVRNSP